MGNVVEFKAQGKEYHLSVMDRDGKNWVTAQQVGEALGNKNIKKLIYGLQEHGEIVEGKHWSNVTLLQLGDNQRRARILLSYRGIIRVAMRSQGQRAREFRDWAEDVLYEVMMTGYYGPVYDLSQVEKWREELLELRIGQAIEKSKKVTWKIYREMVRYRDMGLTQRETAKLLDISRDMVQQFERIPRKYNLQLLKGGAAS